MRKRKVKKYLANSFLLAISLLMLLCGKESMIADASENVPLGEVTIDADTTSPYLIPSDSMTKIEPELDHSYVQNTGKLPTFTKNQLHSLSSQTADRFFSAPYYLENGHVIFALMNRNTGDVQKGVRPNIYFVTLVYTDNNGKILSTMSVATGGQPPAANSGVATEKIGHYATVPSNISRLSDGNFEVKYNGQTPTDKRSNQFRSLKFTITNNQLVGLNWSNVSFNIPATNIALEQLHRMHGTELNIIHGISARGVARTPVYYWDETSNRYVRRVTLQIPAATLKEGVDGVWSYDIGFNPAKNEYYGVLVARNTPGKRDISYLVFWDRDGNAIKVITIPNAEQIFNGAINGIRINKRVVETEDIYYTVFYANSTVLNKINLDTKVTEKISVFPKGSNVQIQKSENGYLLCGFSPGSSPENGIKKAGTFLSYLTNDYQVINTLTIGLTGDYTIFDLEKMPNNQFYITGTGTTRDFATNRPSTGCQESNVGQDHKSNAIFGSLNAMTDFSPGIKVTNKNFVIDLTKAENWDEKMLEGLEVYDTYDLNSNIEGVKSQEWLKKRLNRNPRTLKYDDQNNLLEMKDIDWETLGLDKTTFGPQIVKYFITDSSSQTTATSRWVNKVDEDTVYDAHGALGARNFTIPVEDTTDLVWNTNVNDKNNVGKQAQLKAWLLENGTDETSNHNKVTVDLNELEAIQQAKQAYENLGQQLDKSSVLKPYPLTFTYQYEKQKILKKTIQVFVTDRQTTIDQSKDKVIYGYDYPLQVPQESKSETANLSYKHSKLQIYSLKKGTLLADSEKTAGIAIDSAELTRIQQATLSEILPLTYTYTDDKGSLTHPINVHLSLQQATITVSFKDEEGVPQAKPVQLSGEIFTTKDLTKEPSVLTTIQQVLAKGFTLLQSPANEAEIRIEEDGTTVAYVFKGHVSLKSVTKHMRFATGKVTPFAQSLSYDGTEKFKLDILDQRGLRAPKDGYKRGQFSIQATLEQAFSNETQKMLAGAELIYENGTEAYEINSVGTEIYQSKQSQETKAYELMLDDKNTQNKGLRLYVPKGSPIETGTYTAEVSWELVEGP